MAGTPIERVLPIAIRKGDGGSDKKDSGGGGSVKMLLKWGSLKFAIKRRDIVTIKDIGISGSIETKEGESGKFRHVKLKSRKPIEFTVTAQLNSGLTNNVKKQALRMVKQAATGTNHYLYMSGRKVFKCQFMLVSAKISDLTLATLGRWVSCDVALTFKQSSLFNGRQGADVKESSSKSSGSGKSGGGGGGSGRGKKSVRGGGGKKTWLQMTGEKMAKGYGKKETKDASDVSKKASRVSRMGSSAKAGHQPAGHVMEN